MMPDRLKPASAEWYARQQRHRHNSYQGHCRMTMMNMQSIMDSDTATPRAKTAALRVYNKAKALSILLRQRVDPKKDSH